MALQEGAFLVSQNLDALISLNQKSEAGSALLAMDKLDEFERKLIKILDYYTPEVLQRMGISYLVSNDRKHVGLAIELNAIGMPVYQGEGETIQ